MAGHLGPFDGGRAAPVVGEDAGSGGDSADGGDDGLTGLPFADDTGGSRLEVGDAFGGCLVVEYQDGCASGRFGNVGEVVGRRERVDVDQYDVGQPGCLLVG